MQKAPSQHAPRDSRQNEHDGTRARAHNHIPPAQGRPHLAIDTFLRTLRPKQAPPTDTATSILAVSAKPHPSGTRTAAPQSLRQPRAPQPHLPCCLRKRSSHQRTPPSHRTSAGTAHHHQYGDGSGNSAGHLFGDFPDTSDQRVLASNSAGKPPVQPFPFQRRSRGMFRLDMLEASSLTV